MWGGASLWVGADDPPKRAGPGLCRPEHPAEAPMKVCRWSRGCWCEDFYPPLPNLPALCPPFPAASNPVIYTQPPAGAPSAPRPMRIPHPALSPVSLPLQGPCSLLLPLCLVEAHRPTFNLFLDHRSLWGKSPQVVGSLEGPLHPTSVAGAGSCS